VSAARPSEVRSLIAGSVRDKMKGDHSMVEDILMFPENAGASFGGTVRKRGRAPGFA
jgi:hypothetical protein